MQRMLTLALGVVPAAPGGLEGDATWSSAAAAVASDGSLPVGEALVVATTPVAPLAHLAVNGALVETVSVLSHGLLL